MSRDIVKEIREQWFDRHIATLTKHGDLEVLQWKRPGTINYSCRYVFDGNMMYVSGDLGEAVFWLTWRASIHSFNDIHIDYFDEKISAYSGDRRGFDDVKATKRLREWLKEIKEDGKTYDHDDMRELFSDTRGCSSHSEWVEIIHRHDDLISELDQDYWEWLYDCGDEIPRRIHCYLIGLKMASEQLKAVKIEGEI